ncbi:MAG: hypothetical protein QG589_286 [Patescibacteria group bacterium]|nr:hypothetical protein [Patescibacteria group bacterium]
MKMVLKKLFIPHKDNNYVPHLVGKRSLILVGLCTILVFCVAVLGQYVLNRTDMVALVLPHVLVDYTNQDRQKTSLDVLSINPLLERAAQLKADDMVTKGYFAHNSPEGKSPWYWLDAVGYDFSYAGENLAVNFTDSVDVDNAWMNSPGHRDNILNNRFTEIGIATAQGMYEGKVTTFVVQFFGRPTKKINAVSQANPIVVRDSQKELSEKKVITPVSTQVLGEQTDNQLYVAVENKEPASVPSGVVSEKSTIWHKILVSPSKTMSIIYTILGIIIGVGLALIMTTKIKQQHISPLVWGAVILLLLYGLFYLYRVIIVPPVEVL